MPAMKCRAMQALYLLALNPIAETTADPNSYGFRPGRSTADAIEQCFCTLAKQNSPQWVLEGDIKGCFDAISHEWLYARIPMDKTMLRKWLKAGYMDQHVFHSTEEGTPQGGIISPVLANMTLDGLEKLLQKAFPRSVMRKGKCRRALVHFIRYADDVRHLTQYEILLAEKGGSEDDDLWVISPTWTRKPKGKGACEKR
ncbi:MAG TPA: reverse transcriptase domain-containing protein, partial [Ktedonobacteraceae bacterium]